MNVSVQLIAISFLFLSVSNHHVKSAEVFRWVDEDGNVHYSDVPQSDSAEKISISDQKSKVDDERIRKRQRLLDVMLEERQQKNNERENLRVAAEERKRKCDQVNEKLQQFINSGVLYEDTGDPLNPRVLSSDERNIAIEYTRREVQQWCGTKN
jgi:hypothetical protein